VNCLLIGDFLAHERRCCQRIVNERRGDSIGSHRVRVRQQVRVGAQHRLRVIAETSGHDGSGTGGIAVSASVALVWRRMCSDPTVMPADGTRRKDL
jgi:hypothetical protein